MRKTLISFFILALFTLSATAVLAQGKGNHPMFDKMDANKDGSLTKEEVQKQFPKFNDEMFKKADTNGDGKLSLEEWQAFARAWHGKRKADSGM